MRLTEDSSVECSFQFNVCPTLVATSHGYRVSRLGFEEAKDIAKFLNIPTYARNYSANRKTYLHARKAVKVLSIR